MSGGRAFVHAPCAGVTSGTGARKSIDYFEQAIALDPTFALIERLYETRSLDLLGLKGDPAWDELRSDRRFQELLRRFGLAP